MQPRGGSAVRAANRHRLRAARRREGERLLDVVTARESESEAGRKGVTGTVGIAQRAWQRSRPVGAFALARHEPAALAAHRRDDQLRRWVQLARLVPLGEVASAVHERVQLDACFLQRRQLASGGDDDARLSRRAERLRVAGTEVDSVDAGEL
jgi:hypothetical protein